MWTAQARKIWPPRCCLVEPIAFQRGFFGLTAWPWFSPTSSNSLFGNTLHVRTMDMVKWYTCAQTIANSDSNMLHQFTLNSFLRPFPPSFLPSFLQSFVAPLLLHSCLPLLLSYFLPLAWLPKSPFLPAPLCAFLPSLASFPFLAPPYAPTVAVISRFLMRFMWAFTCHVLLFGSWCISPKSSRPKQTTSILGYHTKRWYQWIQEQKYLWGWCMNLRKSTDWQSDSLSFKSAAIGWLKVTKQVFL